MERNIIALSRNRDTDSGQNHRLGKRGGLVLDNVNPWGDCLSHHHRRVERLELVADERTAALYHYAKERHENDCSGLPCRGKVAD